MSTATTLKKCYKQEAELVETALKEKPFVEDLIKCLLNLRANTHAELSCGICFQLAQRISKLKKYTGNEEVYSLCYKIVSYLSLTWPKHSGAWSCPVPIPPDHTEDVNWVGEQLKLRHELIDHIIEELKARKD